MKKFFATLLALCMMVPTALEQGSPLVYRVSDAEGHVLYLFGTVHVGDENMYDLVESVYETLGGCDRLALEIDPIALTADVRANMKTMASLYLKQGDSIVNYLSEETVDKGLELFEEPKAYMLRLTPAMWFSLAQELTYSAAGMSSDYGVDNMLAYAAYAENIEVVSLESMDEQLAIFDQISNELYDFMIYSTLVNVEQYAKDIQTMVKAWSEGDSEMLTKMLLEDTEEIPPELQNDYDEYLRLIQFERDDGFLEDAVRLIKEDKTTMIAIGAAHIVGENGLAARLSALGYTVEVVMRYLSADLADQAIGG